MNEYLIAVLSDVHGNEVDFNQAIGIAQQKKVKEIIFLGDILGYIPSTDALKKLMEEKHQIQAIKGNHEIQILYKKSAQPANDITKHSEILSDLNLEEIRYLQSLPLFLEKTYGKKTYLFIHGSPTDFTNGYFYENTIYEKKINKGKYDVIVMGNTHIPFIREEGETFLINVGSVGLPRDDGRFGSLAILDVMNNVYEILRYPLQLDKDELKERYGERIHGDVYRIFDRRFLK